MDMADVIAEIKRLKEKIQELEGKGADDARITAIEDKIDALNKKLSKPLEESNFEEWD